MDTGPGRVDALNFVCGAMKLFSANDASAQRMWIKAGLHVWQET